MRTPKTFQDHLNLINDPVLRDVIEQEFPNDTKAARIAIRLERALITRFEGFDKRFDNLLNVMRQSFKRVDRKFDKLCEHWGIECDEDDDNSNEDGS